MKNRDYVLFYLNGQRREVRGEQVFKSVTDFLRYDLQLTGTKVVCAEGDCGACTLNLARAVASSDNAVGDSLPPFQFKAVNSCILFVFQLDGCSVVSVEGLKQQSELHPVQKAMTECFGSQCGFCTPGFVGSMAQLADDAICEKFEITEKKARNYLTGNLCRCTGYAPILKACQQIDLAQVQSLSSRYGSERIVRDLSECLRIPVDIKSDHRQVLLPINVKEAAELKAHSPELRLVSGATDLGVMINKNRFQWQQLMSLQNCSDLYAVTEKNQFICIGARASLTQVEKHLQNIFPQFSELLHVFASPQIKNSGTLIGNLVNGSPIGDTLPFLMVCEAQVVVLSVRGERRIPLDQFYLGYKKLDLQTDELVVGVEIPKQQNHFKLYKICNRKDLDISVVTFAIHFEKQADRLSKVRFALGGVGPVVQRFSEIESLVQTQDWSANAAESSAIDVATRTLQLIKPLSDVRATSEYRNLLVKNFWKKFARELEAL